jgi:endonuclease/exonuclease/phosphatase family metal-dependent hydrolase
MPITPPFPIASRSSNFTVTHANLQHATENSDPMKLAALRAHVEASQPDIVALQEVGENFALDVDGYELVHAVFNPKVTGESSQLNLQLWRRTTSSVRVESSSTIRTIPRYRPTIRRPASRAFLDLSSRLRNNRQSSPFQRRGALAFTLRAPGQSIEMVAVHADASDSGGNDMLSYLTRRARAGKHFVGFGDINAHLDQVLERAPKLRDVIAAPRDANGKVLPTRVRADDYGDQAFSSLDGAVHSPSIVMQYSEPLRATYTHPTNRDRAKKIRTNNRLHDHFIMHADVWILTEAEKDRRDDVFVSNGVGRHAPPLRIPPFSNPSPEQIAAFTTAKNAQFDLDRDPKVVPSKKRMREEEERDTDMTALQTTLRLQADVATNPLHAHPKPVQSPI